MAKTPSMFVPLDVNYLRDPKIRRAGSDAELLFLRSLAYAKGGETDGKVWHYDLEVIAVGLRNTRPRVQKLIECDLWEEREGHWYIVGWEKWNDTVQKLRDRKSAQAKGAAITNHKKHRVNGHDFIGSCAVCTGEVEA